MALRSKLPVRRSIVKKVPVDSTDKDATLKPRRRSVK
jgi:hypothetical protein